MSGEDRVKDLEQKHAQCNHEVSMHLAASHERWLNQIQTNKRYERCCEAMKDKLNDLDTKIRTIENKVAWWAGAAAMIGTAIPLLVKYFLG